MNIYYFCHFNIKYKNFFEETIKKLSSYNDIDNKISDNFMLRGDTSTYKWFNDWFLFEALLFIKYIWKKYWVKPLEIKWLYKNNMVILNEDLYVDYDWKWESTYWKDTYFFTSRMFYDDIFWSFWDKLSSLDNKFAKLVSTNKNISSTRIEKLTQIMNIYEDREKLIWDFMLPLMYQKSLNDISNILNLWKDKTKKDDLVIKWSYWVDNWKLIKLIKISDYIWIDEKLEYLYLKFFQYLKTNSNIYIIDFYNNSEEKRLYFTRDYKIKDYNLYSVKEKINITQKEELFDKTSFSTWNNIKMKWKLWDKSKISDKLLNIAKSIYERNNLDTWAIEFMKNDKWEWRFLEINCLWGALMYKWEDEINMKNRILDMWHYNYTKEKNKKLDK